MIKIGTRARLVRAAAAVLLGVAAPTSADEGTAAPGVEGDHTLNDWTLNGGLPPAVVRTTDLAPLSDQSNSKRWRFNAERSDEFDGESLDEALWSPRHRTWRGRAPALFSADNVEVSDGRLQLWMRKDGEPPEGGSEFHTYTSASVQAKETSLYGYYEVRAKPMDSAGSSSFWFAGQSDGWRTEIDVFELGGKALNHERRFNMNAHLFWSPDDRRHRNWGGVWHADFRFAEGFHVFGLAWTPEELTYYVDGHPVRRLENRYWRQPIYLIFDSETMPDWLGMPDDEDLPSVYEIDYVRVWDLPQPLATDKGDAGGG